MSNDEQVLQGLITRLQQIQLERDTLLREERQVTARLEEAVRATREGSRNGTGASDPGRVSPPPQAGTQREGTFNVGERVIIVNRIRHVPFSRRATPADRAATVQRVTEDRIFITTYNGYSTWRRASNLRRLTEQEHRNIAG